MPLSPDKPHAPGTVTAALVAVQLLFGLHYIVAKWILAELEPGAWALLRSLSALAVLLLIWFVRDRGRLRGFPAPRRVAYLALCALFGVVLNQILFLEGLARTTASHAAMMNTQIPSFALLGALVLRQERLGPREALSFGLGLLGVLILLEVDRFRLGADTLTGDLLCLGNAASYGLFIVLSRRVMAEEDSLAATALLFAFACLGIGLYGATGLAAAPLGQLSGRALGGMAFAVLGATVLSYFLNIWALGRTRASHVALFIFLQPVVAALLGVIFLGENVSPRWLIALILVFMALFLRDGRAGAGADSP